LAINFPPVRSSGIDAKSHGKGLWSWDVCPWTRHPGHDPWPPDSRTLASYCGGGSWTTRPSGGNSELDLVYLETGKRRTELRG